MWSLWYLIYTLQCQVQSVLALLLNDGLLITNITRDSVSLKLDYALDELHVEGLIVMEAVTLQTKGSCA